MTALTSDANLASRDRNNVYRSNLTMASNTTIYGGSLVTTNASGLAIPAADTSGTVFVGIAEKQVINPSGGTLQVTVEYGDVYLLTQDGSLAITDMGAIVEVLDSGTVCKSTNSTNHIKVGRLVEFVSSTQVWVRLTVGNP